MGFAYPPLSIPVLNPKEKLPNSMSFLRVEPENLIVSAVKQWEDGEGIIIRFYNISGETLTGSVETSFQFSEAWKTDLNEQPVMRAENIENKMWLKVEPGEIIRLLLKQSRKTACG
jgi:alpha-mannosidase